MGDSGTDIIVKGGSVQLLFDTALYQPDPNDPNRRHHDDRKITRIRVEDRDGTSLFDKSSDEGLMWTVTVSTK
jgi:hypothetical protein